MQVACAVQDGFECYESLDGEHLLCSGSELWEDEFSFVLDLVEGDTVDS